MTSNPSTFNTKSMAKNKWLIFQVEGEKYILNDNNEQSIKAILLDRYQPFTLIACLDYSTGVLIDTFRLDELYELYSK